MIPHAICWSLWRERNLQTFEDVEASNVAVKSPCFSMFFFFWIFYFYLLALNFAEIFQLST